MALVCTFGYTLCVPLERKGYESWAINALDLVLVVVLVKSHQYHRVLFGLLSLPGFWHRVRVNSCVPFFVAQLPRWGFPIGSLCFHLFITFKLRGREGGSLCFHLFITFELREREPGE